MHLISRLVSKFYFETRLLRNKRRYGIYIFAAVIVLCGAVVAKATSHYMEGIYRINSESATDGLSNTGTAIASTASNGTATGSASNSRSRAAGSTATSTTSKTGTALTTTTTTTTTTTKPPPTGQPSPPVLGRAYKNAEQITIHGVTYRVQSPGMPWSNLLSSDFASFELRQGEYWSNDTHKPSARSELASNQRWSFDTDVWLSFAFYLPSDSRLPTQNWVVAGQFHASEDADESSTSPPFAQYFNSGVFQVETRSNPDATNNGINVTPVVRYSDANFPRNTWVRMVYHLRFSRTGTGFLQAWRDGKEIIPASNIPLGYNDNLGVYWKFGVYRYKPSPGTTSLKYANMEVGTGSLQSRISKPLPIPQ